MDKAKVENLDVESGAMVPMESPATESGEIISIMADDVFVNQMEKAAENAPRIQAALEKLLVSISYPGDWVDLDGSACLSSAGAERFLKHFPISFTDWKWRKENWSDEEGEAYKYIYEAQCHLWGRTVQTQGIYSTRDKFLGKTSEGWRSLKDINTSNIQSAARHICIGNGIKTLLGLRGVSTEKIKEVFNRMGKAPDNIQSVKYSKGSKGGAVKKQDKAEAKQDDELRARCNEMLTQMHAGDAADMKAAVKDASSFEGADGKTVSRDDLNKINGKWLAKVYGIIKEQFENWEKITGGDFPNE